MLRYYFGTNTNQNLVDYFSSIIELLHSFSTNLCTHNTSLRDMSYIVKCRNNHSTGEMHKYSLIVLSHDEDIFIFFFFWFCFLLEFAKFVFKSDMFS